MHLDGVLGRRADHGLHLEREEKHQLNLIASNWIQVRKGEWSCQVVEEGEASLLVCIVDLEHESCC